MKIIKKINSPQYIRNEGIKSYLLASLITSNSKFLTTTLVEIDKGGIQRTHTHYPEQIYFIISGSGKMTVGNETHQVEVNDCIFVPSNEPHGVIYDGNSKLIYFSVSAPSFTNEELLNFWPLQSDTDSK